MADTQALAEAARQREQEAAWKDAADLWRECIWRSADDEHRPAWCAAYGRALLEDGRTLHAIAVLDRAVKLYPDAAACRSNLALAYARAGAPDLAAPVWAELLARFAEHPDRRWWLPSSAYGLLELGQLELAEEAGLRTVADYPESAAGHAVLSVIAERRFHWAQALAHVEKALQLCTPSEHAGLVVSKLRILGEMGAAKDCAKILGDELRRTPDHPLLLAAAAELSTRQGPLAEAKQRWDACIAQSPDAPEGYLGKSALQRATGEPAAAAALLREACARWPGLISLRQALAETCAQLRDMEGARREWAVAEQLAPLSVFRLWAQCGFLGSIGAGDEAEAMLARREASGRVLWRGRFEYAKSARELDRALACLDEMRKASATEAVLTLADAEIRSWRQDAEDLEQAEASLRAILAVSPAAVRVADLLARVLVLLDKPEDALRLVSGIPAADTRRAAGELRLWSDVHRAEWRAAATRWKRLAGDFFLPALHLPRAELRVIGGKFKPSASGGVLAMSVLRNERPRLQGFLDHHRQMGVEGFVLIDNGSSDGSDAFLAAQPDVLLYATDDSYAQSQYGARWLNQLIDLHGKGWVVYVDADERLVFPGSEKRSLSNLVGYMSDRGEQVLAGVMIDMFPRHAGEPGPVAHDWFDPLRIRASVQCPFIEAAGGARRRLFGTTVTLSKAPLINAGAGVRYLTSHATTPARVSAVTAGLLHYHLDYLFDASNVQRLKDEVARAEHSDHAVDRRRSLAIMHALSGADLKGPHSQRYRNSAQLLRLGLIATTKEFEERSG